MTDSRTISMLRIAGAAFVLAGGVVHLQQWDEGLRFVPKIGTLFLVNAAASVVVALWLVVMRDRWSTFAGIALTVGTLGGLLIAHFGTLFEYSDPTWRTPIVVAVVVEVAAVALLTASLLVEHRRDLPARVATA